VDPVAVVILVGAIAFLFGGAALVVFGPPAEEQAPATAIDWLIRGLVGAAVAHTALAVYNLTQQAHDSGDELQRVLLSDTVMNLFAYAGILLALAALLHLLSRRAERPR
jgi:hypothetical protein